ncbi:MULTISPECIES: hypothetical protein [Bradyrhizobium]|nr:hypothetical protein [Bradyrhizobium liaoningense]MBR0985837.1 hypothetical protein [Bradyrhizobium liaoningense]
MKRQSAASLTISCFHNAGLRRHVFYVGEVKSFLFADRNKKRQGPHRWSGGVRGKQLSSAMELGRDD